LLVLSLLARLEISVLTVTSVSCAVLAPLPDSQHHDLPLQAAVLIHVLATHIFWTNLLARWGGYFATLSAAIIQHRNPDEVHKLLIWLHN